MKRIGPSATPHFFAVRRWGLLTISAIAGALLFANSDAMAADHALCGTVFGNDVIVNVLQDTDCSSPAPVLYSGSLSLGNILIDSSSTATLNGATIANGTATFNGASTFNGGNTFNGTATFANATTTNGAATFNGSGTFNGTATFNNSVTFNGAAAFNGITNTGNITTDTLTANTSINTPLITATTANVTTANITTANATTANIGIANVSTALQVTPGATVNMGGNRVQNVGTPLTGTDAANRNYVDASIAGISTQVDQSLSNLSTRIDDASQRATKATAGVAMAFAMAGVPTVLPNERVAFTMNYGNFQGQNGMAINGAVRLDNNFQLTGGVGYAANQNIVGARAGLRVGW